MYGNWRKDIKLDYGFPSSKNSTSYGVEYYKTYDREWNSSRKCMQPNISYIMINYMCINVKGDIGRALFADDGAIWKRGRHIACVSQRLQKAVDKVEVWANKWSFRLSVAKTQVTCFTKVKRVPRVKFKLYKQEMEQVSVVQYLGVWMKSRLTFAMHA